MGWLFMTGLDGYSSPRSYLDNQFTYQSEHHRSTVLASALVQMSTYYAAVEHVKPDGYSLVFAAVCLVKYNPKAADGYIFGYKDMDETMGPCEAECPKDILDLLTPTDRPHAVAWRARCRALIEARRAQGARPLPKPGQTIIFDEPLSLSNGETVDRFTVVAGRGPRAGVLYAIPGSGALVRISNVRRRAYRLINPAVSAP